MRRLMGDLRRAAAHVYTSRLDLQSYTYDAQGCGEPPLAVVLPATAGEVQAVVLAAARHGVAVIPRGAGTNLCGATLAHGPAVVVCTSRMRRLLRLSAAEQLAVVEPGITNHDLQEAARSHGLFFPPDPASFSASTLGGNIAQNAGGMRGLKYGVTGDYVLGLDVVLADGTLVELGGACTDAPGPDVTALMVGSEGTLGVVTRAVLRLLPIRPQVRTIIALFDRLEDAGTAVQRVVAAGLVPMAMELIDSVILSAASRRLDMDQLVGAEAMLLVELDGFDGSVDDEATRVSTIMAGSGGRGVRRAASDEERDRLWLARRNAAASVTLIRPGFLDDDVTVPRGRLVDMLSRVRDISARHSLPIGSVCHAGDGNLHPIILFDDSDPGETVRARAARREIIAAAIDMGGTVTGEHGIGVNKLEFMPMVYRPQTLWAMRGLKLRLDPGDVLNPGKAVPRDLAGPGREPPASEDRALWIRGAGSSLPSPGDRDILCTARWDRVDEVDRANMSAVAGAGISLGRLEQLLAREGLFFPAGRWEPRRSTLGSLVARNATGPGRARYRGLKAQVLGMTMLTGDGLEIDPGGRTLKNAAGYNLTRLVVGSLGTLGAVTGLCVRVFPVPGVRRWLVIEAAGPPEAAVVVTGLAGAVDLASLLAVRGVGLGPLHPSSVGLLVELEGESVSVGAAVDAVREVAARSGAHVVHDASGDEMDAAMRSLLEDATGAPGFGGVVRAGLGPGRIVPAMAGDWLPAGAWVLGHPLEGVMEVCLAAGELPYGNPIAGAPGGHVVVRHGPEWPDGLPLIDGPDRSRFDIMARVKGALDPGHNLPGLPVGRSGW